MLKQDNSSIKDLSPSIEYLKQSFDQMSFISKAALPRGKFFLVGLCSGFCIDYAMYTIKYRNGKPLPNYLKMLKRKFRKTDENLKEFIYKIGDYQSFQPIHYEPTHESTIQEKQILGSLNSDFKSTSLVFLGLYSNASKERGAHAITLYLVRNNDQEIVSHRVFDPNFGEYQVDEAEKCNEIISNLSKHYNYSKCKAFDLEKFIIENELIKGGMDYSSTNPNAAKLLSMKFLYHCREGNAKVVKLLLKDPRVNVNITCKDGWTPMTFACRERSVEIIKLLLADVRVDVNISTQDGWTPLHIACEKSRIEVVKLLLKDPRVNFNIPNKDGRTPISIACGKSKTEVVKLLLADARFDVNIPDKNGYTPLYVACVRDKIEVIKLLLVDSRIDINTSSSDCSPLRIACLQEKIGVIKLLLADPRVDVNLSNRDGWNPVMSAANNKNIKIVQLLADKGADISQISEEIKKMLKIPRFKEKAGQKLELEKEVYNS